MAKSGLFSSKFAVTVNAEGLPLSRGRETMKTSLAYPYTCQNRGESNNSNGGPLNRMLLFHHPCLLLVSVYYFTCQSSWSCPSNFSQNFVASATPSHAKLPSFQSWANGPSTGSLTLTKALYSASSRISLRISS